MSNIDHTEVDKFSSIADQWWNPDGALKTLHDINPVRLAYIDRQASLKSKTVLDIGCGGGILSESMATTGARVTGIDASEENIAIANEHAQQSGLDILYINSSAEEFMTANSEQFDVVTCMELLEHVPDPKSLINACSSLVKPGGHVIFSTINRNIKSYLSTIIAAEYMLSLIPKGTHSYNKFIRPSELNSWCKDHLLQLNDISGMSYIPYINQCHLSPTPDVNYLMDTVKRTDNSGSRSRTAET